MPGIFGVLRSLVGWSDESELPNQADMFLTLPPTWRLGLHPSAAPEARAHVKEDGVIGFAYDATRDDHEYQPTLVVWLLAPGPDEPPEAATLDWVEDAIKAARGTIGSNVVDVDRVVLPVGEAVRYETRVPHPRLVHPIAYVYYHYVVPSDDSLAAWGLGSGDAIQLEFSCGEQQLPLYRSEFDAIAQTLFNPPGAEPDGSVELGSTAGQRP